MFIPKKFQQHDFVHIKSLMTEFPLATIVAASTKTLESSHVPLYFAENADDSEYGFLYGHIAKVNPLYTMPANSQWLVIFQDTGHYISPNWYPNKAITHKEVPTWNYRSVHFAVEPTFTTNPIVLKQLIRQLSDIHEATQPMPWSLNDAPEQYIEAMCKAIVGFKLKITGVQAQFKLSQNKDKATIASIIKNLRRLNTDSSNRMADHIDESNKQRE